MTTNPSFQRLGHGAYRCWLRTSFDGVGAWRDARVTRASPGAWYWTIEGSAGERAIGGEDHYRTAALAKRALREAGARGFKHVPQLGWCLAPERSTP